MKRGAIRALGILTGFLLSLPLTYGLIQYKAKHRGVEVNGWQVSFRTGDFGSNYLLRAAVALTSLGNAVPEEALFFHVFYDADGKPLNGRNKYVLTFPQGALPPVKAFWSLTVYDADTGYLIENPIDRYTLGDRTKDLVLNADGSLSVYLQTRAPEERLRANWLPVPDRDFSVTLRCYLPGEEILRLDWRPPRIVNAGAQGGD